MDTSVPLVVPEVNRERVREHRGIIASPNCSTVQLVVPLKPLDDSFGVRRVVVSSYQSVSGNGADAMAELREQSEDVLRGRPPSPSVYPKQIAFNVIPHIDSFSDDGYTGEERKVMLETRKILEKPGLMVTATCVRVPVYIGHAEAVLAELDRPFDISEVRALLARSPGVRVIDRAEGGTDYPVPVLAAGRDEVFVGRIRKDSSSGNGLWMWVVTDNLRKGAAVNAVQIAEALIEEGLL
jgi:aspartate-semialdehyde dehydrogenase